MIARWRQALADLIAPRRFFIATHDPRTGSILVTFYTDVAVYAAAIHEAELNVRLERIDHWKCGEVQ